MSEWYNADIILAIVLSVFLRYMDSDCPFGIYKLFLCVYADGIPGADPGFQVKGRTWKIAPSGGRRENFWGISCEKSWFYAKKSYFFQF